MKIYTSYFGNLKEIKKRDILPLSIAVVNPKYISGVSQFHYFCPPYKLVQAAKSGDISRERYDVVYNEQLSRLKIKDILKDLNTISDGRDVALLCYEKDRNECHRDNVAKWIENESGIIVEELYSPTKNKKVTQLKLF